MLKLTKPSLCSGFRSLTLLRWADAAGRPIAARLSLPGFPRHPARRVSSGRGRYPFTEYAERGPGWQGEGGALKPDPEPEARSLFLEFLGPEDYQTQYPRAFLRQLEQIEAVQAVLSCKERYEVVEICAPPECPRDLLGFDVGYWGGGNFSILCDATVWPLWHAPSQSALPDLARAVAALNKHVLLPTELAATEYLSWYCSQPWGEQDPGEFSVMAIGAVVAAAG